MTEISSIPKISKFNGKRADWLLWSEVFLARLEAKELSEVLWKKPEEIPKNDEVDKNNEEQVNLQVMNRKVYMELMSWIDMKKKEGKQALRLVIMAKTKDYPSGNAPLAWSHLKRKYAPRTATELAYEKRTYENAVMLKGQDPDSFLDYLEQKRNRLLKLGKEITDEEFVVDIINKLTDEYDNVIEKVNDMLDDETDAYDILMNIRDRLRSIYQRLRLKGNN